MNVLKTCLLCLLLYPITPDMFTYLSNLKHRYGEKLSADECASIDKALKGYAK